MDELELGSTARIVSSIKVYEAGVWIRNASPTPIYDAIVTASVRDHSLQIARQVVPPDGDPLFFPLRDPAGPQSYRTEAAALEDECQVVFQFRDSAGRKWVRLHDGVLKDRKD